jgi:hypothetical protein
LRAILSIKVGRVGPKTRGLINPQIQLLFLIEPGFLQPWILLRQMEGWQGAAYWIRDADFERLLSEGCPGESSEFQYRSGRGHLLSLATCVAIGGYESLAGRDPLHEMGKFLI